MLRKKPRQFWNPYRLNFEFIIISTLTEIVTLSESIIEVAEQDMTIPTLIRFVDTYLYSII